MALTKSFSINGEDARVAYGIAVLEVSGRGMGAVRRGSTPLGETNGRVGQQGFLDEKIFRFSGQISSGNRAGVIINFRKLTQALNLGRDGRRTFVIRFEDTTTPADFICHYAGDFNLGEISHTWFTNYVATFTFTAAVQSGWGFETWNVFQHNGISSKKILYVSATTDIPVRPQVIIGNTNATPVTALTLRNFARRRVLRKLTGTMSAAFAPGGGPFGLGITITTGTHTYSFANDALWPFERGWTILFRFQRVFGTGTNRTFWQTSTGGDKLIYNNTSGNLELVLNGVVTGTFGSAIANLPTASFVQVACRYTPLLATSKTLDTADIFVGTTKGNTAINISTEADPGANLYFGTDNAGGTRAEGGFDEIIIFNRALSDEEIQGLAQGRPLASLEGVCLYVDFETGVNGVGMSNLDMTFSGISLGLGDNLIIDCEHQTAKKITQSFVVTDQLSFFSGEFMELEPGDNMLQFLVTGGAAASNNVGLNWSDRMVA